MINRTLGLSLVVCALIGAVAVCIQKVLKATRLASEARAEERVNQQLMAASVLWDVWGRGVCRHADIVPYSVVLVHATLGNDQTLFISVRSISRFGASNRTTASDQASLVSLERSRVPFSDEQTLTTAI